MTNCITNKFKGITFDHLDENSKSEILVRTSYNPLRFGGPVAIVKCGECENIYKESLLSLSSYFVMNTHLTCTQCGNIDNLTYRSSKIKMVNF